MLRAPTSKINALTRNNPLLLSRLVLVTGFCSGSALIRTLRSGALRTRRLGSGRSGISTGSGTTEVCRILYSISETQSSKKLSNTSTALDSATLLTSLLPVFAAYLFLYILSAMRSLALRALGLSSSSSSPGRIGFFVMILIFGLRPQTQTGNSFGQIHGSSNVLNVCFTILSSKE